MKNKSEFWGLFANVIAILLLLCFIILGLNRIGIYDLPEPVERFLGTNNKNDSVAGNDAEVYDSLKYNGGNEVYSRSEITYENAMKLMKEVSPRENYSHEICVSHYYNDTFRNENFSILRRDGFFDITVSDASGKRIKHLLELNDKVRIESLSGSAVIGTAEFDKGKFNLSDECGFILTVDEFIKARPELDNASFVVRETENDVFVDVSFNAETLAGIQSLNYVVSLEYGIVTEVKCYESDNLVYQMQTISLEKTTD